MTNGTITAEIARSRQELDQPPVSVQLLEPFTRQLFLEAGLKPGMRVLDVGSGGGDVALLVREIVGPDGSVIGVDESAQSVGYANDRAAFRGLTNVEFIEAMIEDLPFGADFDAVVGRILLAYRRDPARDLRTLARCLRPAGIMVMQELDHMSARTMPPAPVIDELRELFLETFERAGVELEMGPKLYATFQAAGLPPPRMRLDGLIGGAESTAPLLITTVVRTLLPQIEALGGVTPDDVQVENLEDRIRLELTRTGGIMQTALLIGAWTKLSA
jgi:ubiquinone/menaquinone biosynthesis C-methylase UbiE